MSQDDVERTRKLQLAHHCETGTGRKLFTIHKKSIEQDRARVGGRRVWLRMLKAQKEKRLK